MQSVAALIATCFILLSCFAYSSTLKKEAKCCSETSVEVQQTTGRYIPEDITLLYSNLVEELETETILEELV
jgi:hypothetical protein